MLPGKLNLQKAELILIYGENYRDFKQAPS